jgi:hypothetical protein
MYKQESMGSINLYPLCVNPFVTLKKCAKNCTHHHVVNISVWAVIGAAKPAAPLYSKY